MIRKNLVSLTMIVALIFGGGLLGCDQLGGEAQLIITATHVHKAPTSLEDPVWQETEAVLIPVKGREILGGEEATVFTKAIYNDQSLYFLFRWVDPGTIPTQPPRWTVPPQYVFKHNKGNCVAITDFIIHCLRKGGYRAYELKVPSNKYQCHSLCVFEENGKKYRMDNGRPWQLGILPYRKK